jgi:flagellar biosynthesis/type III secretory pathway protein FliH
MTAEVEVAFRSYASLLAAPEASHGGERIEPPTPPPILPRPVNAPESNAQIDALLSSFASEIVRLRARAAELVESEAESLLQLIASRVLVRELELRPADIGRLIADVRREWNTSHVARFRVAAADAERLRELEETIVVDPGLQPGDLQVEFADGMLDLRLGSRLAAMLETCHVSV